MLALYLLRIRQQLCENVMYFLLACISFVKLISGDIMQLQFVKSTLTVNPCMVSDVIFVKHAVSALNFKWESEVVLF